MIDFPFSPHYFQLWNVLVIALSWYSCRRGRVSLFFCRFRHRVFRASVIWNSLQQYHAESELETLIHCIRWRWPTILIGKKFNLWICVLKDFEFDSSLIVPPRSLQSVHAWRSPCTLSFSESINNPQTNKFHLSKLFVDLHVYWRTFTVEIATLTAPSPWAVTRATLDKQRLIRPFPFQVKKRCEHDGAVDADHADWRQRHLVLRSLRLRQYVSDRPSLRWRLHLRKQVGTTNPFFHVMHGICSMTRSRPNLPKGCVTGWTLRLYQ